MTQSVSTTQVIVAVAGTNGDVTISGTEGDSNKHAVFSMAEADGFDPKVVSVFGRLARASRTVQKATHGGTPPSHRSLASSFVQRVLKQTPRLDLLGSCFTPTGWMKDQSGECKSFALAAPKLDMISDGRPLTMRFFVSVTIKPAPSATPTTSGAGVVQPLPMAKRRTSVLRARTLKRVTRG